MVVAALDVVDGEPAAVGGGGRAALAVFDPPAAVAVAGEDPAAELSPTGRETLAPVGPLEG